jgi:hypothetical protein
MIAIFSNISTTPMIVGSFGDAVASFGARPSSFGAGLASLGAGAAIR